jgi:hypothetical protein
MSRNSAPRQEPVNPLAPPSVIGLEPGREIARRNQRRRRLRDSATFGVGALVAAVFVMAAAYVGYTIFDEQQSTERIESEQRRAELQEQRSGDNVLDAIDDLEDSPKWNGPGNPNFGVGDD